MADAYSILPPDCWELIFKRVDNWEVISLVCKNFLSLSNSVRQDLKVYSSSMKLFIRFLKRFRYLKRIDFSDFHGDINRALREIARSGLNLESLNVSKQNKFLVESLKELGSNMKILDCLEIIPILKDSDLIAISTSLPLLEEININYKGLTEVGLQMLSKGFPNLQKIDIFGYNVFYKQTLLDLPANCLSLKKIKVRSDRNIIDEDCIGYLLRHCHNLASLSVSNICRNSSQSSFTIENSISYAKNLCELEFFAQEVTDGILCAIANARIPLKKLKLEYCFGYSIPGLSICLNAHQCLEELSFKGNRSLKDRDMSEFLKYLENITYINLNSCGCLTGSTFFNLLKNCPSLIEMDMSYTKFGIEEEDFGTNLWRNYNVQNLRLVFIDNLEDDLLKKIGYSCPNLQLLDTKSCFKLTTNGIREVLKCCNNMKCLKVGTKRAARIFRTDLPVSGIEVLDITNVDDEDMKFIAERCRGLRKLRVLCANDLTNKGVMMLVEKCVKLREIKLKICDGVNVDTLPLTSKMVSQNEFYLWKTNFV